MLNLLLSIVILSLSILHGTDKNSTHLRISYEGTDLVKQEEELQEIIDSVTKEEGINREINGDRVSHILLEGNGHPVVAQANNLLGSDSSQENMPQRLHRGFCVDIILEGALPLVSGFLAGFFTLYFWGSKT